MVKEKIKAKELREKYGFGEKAKKQVVAFNLDKPIKLEFQNICTELKLNKSKIVNELIAKWVDDNRIKQQ